MIRAAPDLAACWTLDPEVIYLDEEAGKPFRGWTSNVLRG